MNSKFFLRRETYFVVFHNTTRFHRPNSHEQTIQIFLRHTLWKVIDNQIRSRFFIVFTLLLLRLYLLLLWLWLLFSLVRHFRPFRRILLLFLACNPILLLLLLIAIYWARVLRLWLLCTPTDISQQNRGQGQQIQKI